MDNTNIVAKDKRYRLLKPLIDSVEGFTFQSIFRYIPKTVVARDLGIPYSVFLKKVKSPKNFKEGEVARMSVLLGLGKHILPQLIEGHSVCKWPIRYAAAAAIIRGDVGSFSHIFIFIPMIALARDMDIPYDKLRQKVRQPELFTNQEIKKWPSNYSR